MEGLDTRFEYAEPKWDEESEDGDIPELIPVSACGDNDDHLSDLNLESAPGSTGDPAETLSLDLEALSTFPWRWTACRPHL